METKENRRPIINIEFEINAGGRRFKNVQEDIANALESILTKQSDKITSLNFKILNATA